MGMRHENLDVPQPIFEKPVFSNLDSLDYAGQNPDVVVRVGDSGVSYSNGCGSGLYSKDNGIKWTMFPKCAPGVGNQTTFAGLIALDASAKSFVWAAQLTEAPYNETGPYSTQDYGKTWVAPKGLLNCARSVLSCSFGRALVLAPASYRFGRRLGRPHFGHGVRTPQGLTVNTGNVAADRVQAKTFYAFDNGIFYISTDSGLSYTSSTASKTGLPAGAGAVPVIIDNC